MITLREYQPEAIEWLSRQRCGTICIAAGGGKTLVAAAALSKVVLAKPRTRPVRIGWLANTLEQCQQAKAAMSKFPALANQDIRVACAASMTDWSDRDVLVTDEAHHAASAPSWRSQIESCKGVRWAMTATPPEDPQQLAEMERLLGPILRIDRKRVAKSLAGAIVKWLDATDPNLQEPIDKEIDRTMAWRKKFWRGDEGQLWGQVAWQVCVEMGIVANRLRNEAAIAAASSDKPTLVLVNKIEHGMELAQRIPGSTACYSKMGARKRREAVQAFLDGKVRCLVGTAMFEEGFDVPNAEVMVMVSGGKSARKAEQSTGRVLRQFKGKSHGIIWDFRDRWHPLAAKHSRVRGEVYLKLGYVQQ